MASISCGRSSICQQVQMSYFLEESYPALKMQCIFRLNENFIRFQLLVSGNRFGTILGVELCHYNIGIFELNWKISYNFRLSRKLRTVCYVRNAQISRETVFEMLFNIITRHELNWKLGLFFSQYSLQLNLHRKKYNKVLSNPSLVFLINSAVFDACFRLKRKNFKRLLQRRILHYYSIYVLRKTALKSCGICDLCETEHILEVFWPNKSFSQSIWNLAF